MLANASVNPTIGVRDIGVARDFYETKLGLKPIGEMSDEVQLFNSGNGTIEVYKSEYAGTNKATTMSWEVEDVDSEVAGLKDKGIVFEHYDLPDMELDGDVHVMGDFKAAWFKDPDGNILCLHNH